ncbi:MAG: DUF87 domain-containing protein [Acidimicrobiales bacterium]
MDTSTIDVEPGHFFLGPVVGGSEGENIIYEAADLTTHGVIVGMTGSGKTGLGMVLLEEALLQGIPTLVIDPKGDMGNLLLTFPDLAPGDFRPWVNEGEAQRQGVTPDELATSTAEMWENGLAGSGIGKDRIARLRDIADFTIYTPGSEAGVGLNVIGDLSAPPAGTGDEAVREEIDGLVQGLLALVDIASDPLSGREHVLLANLVHHAWGAGDDLDLASLLAHIQNPPMRKLGVIEIDTFFPPADRTALAMKLNGLLASPSFAAWGSGVPLDIGSMLEGDGGKPKAAIVSIAHLSDEERQFAVTLVLSKLVTWMRAQPGSPDLRALVYMDEVFGFVPPTAEPPAKRPILTILKQARAFGVGMVLSTQNPVDLDYKAISNAGTWMIGRLQTERDKARLLEGMRAAGGDADIDAIGDTIGGLGKRTFLLHTTRGGAPVTFGTRWAMSYLPGPLTRDQIGVLMADRRPVAAEATAADGPAAPAATAAASAPAAPTELADDESAVAPEVADGVEVAYLDPAAPWGQHVGAVAGGRRLQPALAARVRLLFDDTKGDLRHEAEWEAVVGPLGADVDGPDFVAVDYDDRDLRSDPPEGAVYVLPEGKIHTATFFRDAERTLKDHLYRNESLTLLQNPELKLYSRVGESAEEFAERCRRVGDDRADEEADELRAAMAKKQDRVRAAIAKAEDRVRELESDSKDRSRNEVISGAIDVIGGLFGGKSTRSILGGVRRASSSRRTSANAAQRVESAKNRLEERVDELEALADALVEALEDSQDAWERAAATIESFEVGLEKTDITVEDLVLVWVPTR